MGELLGRDFRSPLLPTVNWKARLKSEIRSILSAFTGKTYLILRLRAYIERISFLTALLSAHHGTEIPPLEILRPKNDGLSIQPGENFEAFVPISRIRRPYAAHVQIDRLPTQLHEETHMSKFLWFLGGCTAGVVAAAAAQVLSENSALSSSHRDDAALFDEEDGTPSNDTNEVDDTHNENGVSASWVV